MNKLNSNICLTGGELCVPGDIAEALIAKIKAGEKLTKHSDLIDAPVTVSIQEINENIYDNSSSTRKLADTKDAAVVEKSEISSKDAKIILDATGCGCDKERAAECVLAVAIKDGVVTTVEAAEIITNNMKQTGPRNKEWLDNVDIDSYMRMMKIVYESPENLQNKEHGLFYPYEFNMIDFRKAKLNGKMSGLATTPPHVIFATECEKATNGEVRLYDTFGCVLNSDYSTGAGQHWVSLFVDLRDRHSWTVEFFNSVKEGCYPEITEFCAEIVDGFTKVINNARGESQSTRGGKKSRMSIRSGTSELAAAIRERVKDNVEVTFIPLCKVSHQRSSYQCGVYSIYFIYSRLLGGATADKFADPNHTISDDEMAKFRRAIFLDEKYIKTGGK